MIILHLSDIHFGRENPEYNNSGTFKNHDTILDDLITTVSNMDRSLRPEHIVVTGDIAWHGKTSEFNKARVFFQKLLDSLELTGKDITFCVGNHDVDLSCLCVPSYLNNDLTDEINNAYSYENVRNYEPCIYAYNKFCEDLGVVPFVYPAYRKLNNSYSVGYKDVEFSNGKVIRFIAFNTSLLLSGQNIAENNLWIGQSQVQTLQENGILPADDHIFQTIVLYHHSSHYLHINEISSYDGGYSSYGTLMAFSDLILCGHSESTAQPRMFKAYGGSRLLSAGAVYYSDDYLNTFSMLYFSNNSKKVGCLSYAHDENGWHDWEYCAHLKVSKKDQKKLADVSDLYHCSLILKNEERELTIPIASLSLKNTGSEISFHNKNDYMNPLTVEYGSNNSIPLKLWISDTWWGKLNAIKMQDQLYSFCSSSHPSQRSWRILSNSGEELYSGIDYILSEEHFREAVNSAKLAHIAKCLHLNPFADTNKADRKETEFIYQLLTKGYQEIYSDKNEHRILFNLDELKNIMDFASGSNAFYVTNQNAYQTELMEISIKLDDVIYYAGPFEADLDDLKHKIETGCEGDLRYCIFRSNKAKHYRIYNQEQFEREIQPIRPDAFQIDA